MLKGIPSIISPELLKILCQMGHGDELTIGDGNYPGERLGKRVIRLDGHGVPEVLDAILKIFPLDAYVDHPVKLMELMDCDKGKVETPIWDEYKEIIAKYDARGAEAVENIDRFDFYDKTEKDSYVVIMTGETAIYANVILKKGVVIEE